MTQSCHQNARWEGCACSITSICLERKKGAEPQEDDGSCNDRAGDLADSGGNHGESGWKKHSGKATQDEQPAKDGHKHRPSVRPAIVNAYNGKPSDEIRRRSFSRGPSMLRYGRAPGLMINRMQAPRVERPRRTESLSSSFCRWRASRRE